jgi:hypothetical protein
MSTQPNANGKITRCLTAKQVKCLMRKFALGFFLAAVLGLTACNGVSPTVVVVVTGTSDPRVIQVTVTPSNLAPVASSNPNTSAPAVTATPVVIPATSLPGPTATLSNFPTEVSAQLNIAQQDYEHGFMFWISTTKTIWVLYTSPNNPNAGDWQSYPDTFVDGTDPGTDASLTPPTNLYAPIRGFLKLWKNTSGLKDTLGWATTPEFALLTSYVYQAGGSLDSNGQYVRGPGKHFITDLNRQTFALSEPAIVNNNGTQAVAARGTWVRLN